MYAIHIHNLYKWYKILFDGGAPKSKSDVFINQCGDLRRGASIYAVMIIAHEIGSRQPTATYVVVM